MNIAYPLQFDRQGRTAQVADDAHVRDLIEQFLFTSPGERVNRPGFGSGLLQLVFAPASSELASAIQLTVQAGLQQWLGDLIMVQGVNVDVSDSTITVTVQYVVRGKAQPATVQFTRVM